MCRDLDGKVTPEEVAAAAAYLKDTIGKEGVQELISNLSKDKGPFTPLTPVHCSLYLCSKCPIFSLCSVFFLFVCLQKERSSWKIL